MAVTEILYVRNCRPNATLIRVGSGSNAMKYTLERRGSREDTAALPADFKEDPGVAQFLNRGIIEEITKDQFLNLGVRLSADNNYRLRERSANAVNIPMSNESSRTPTVIADKDITAGAEFRTPRPEFSHPLRSTEEDLQELDTKRQQEVREANPGRADLPDGEAEVLKAQVNELSSLVRELLQRDAERQQEEETKAQVKPKTKKATDTKGKSTRAANAQKKS